ncbi:Papain family cysteine protease [Aureliella helgolandensis]|uniref:Papain family cysteine protease n=2 Tax=Aureliella helgolandensis TaxID=2527968 RepID=A0A518G9L2_9BACT|nr:Papain family cysteine protease [Aureliella helgolandensis]
MGWFPDLPDPRDYTPDHKEVRRLLARLKSDKSGQKSVPASVDLRGEDDAPSAFFSAVADQQTLNCSAVCAVLGLVEYFERRVRGRAFEGSILCLYKMARKLRRTSGDCGVDLRTTLKSLRRFGAVPYDLWYTDAERFDDVAEDASLICAGFALAYQDACYVRLDARGLAYFAKSSKQNVPVPLADDNLCHSLGSQTLRNVKSFLAAGFPVAFGFSVPKSLSTESRILYRPTFDSIRGGQAVLAVGYDDEKDTSPKGAILIRNSWGETWGDAGYGWLPYAYIERQFATDCWTLLKKDWIDPGELSLPSVLVPEISV